MRKLLILIILVAVGAGWYWYKTDTVKEKEVQLMPEVSRPDPSNATFVIEDEKVTLKDGVATDAYGMETSLADILAYGDVNDDDKNDTVLLLIQSGAGSGLFVYTAAYVSGNVMYKSSDAVFLGDRISPQSISIGEDGVIKVGYLDRKDGEPMAAEPTIPTTKTLVYKDGRLEER